MGKGREHDLPKEVFAALPKDPDEQLEVAQRITNYAVSSHVAKLEAETGKLRQKHAEKEHIISGLQQRVITAETTLQETSAKLALALEGQAKLICEKDVLAGQVKKLMCQVSKLDVFKKSLLKALEGGGCDDMASSDGDKSPRSPCGGGGTPAKPPCGSQPSAAISKSTTPPVPTPKKQKTTYSCMKEFCDGISKSPPKSPTTDDKYVGSDKEETSPGTSKQHSNLLTPRMSPASNTRSPEMSPRIDGKEFFRQARNRLSYEQFSAFLSNIKELNAHRQTREDTLKKANETFGPTNYDLYEAFQGLLSRYLPP